MYQEIPILLLSELVGLTGKPIKSFLLINYQYNANFSGPGSLVYTFLIKF